jgi:hypothetical protein
MRMNRVERMQRAEEIERVENMKSIMRLYQMMVIPTEEAYGLGETKVQ